MILGVKLIQDPGWLDISVLSLFGWEPLYIYVYIYISYITILARRRGRLHVQDGPHVRFSPKIRANTSASALIWRVWACH